MTGMSNNFIPVHYTIENTVEFVSVKKQFFANLGACSTNFTDLNNRLKLQ